MGALWALHIHFHGDPKCVSLCDGPQVWDLVAGQCHSVLRLGHGETAWAQLQSLFLFLIFF